MTLFEPLGKHLMINIVLLVVLAFIKMVGDLQALSVTFAKFTDLLKLLSEMIGSQV